MNVFGLLPTHVWRRRVVIQKISFQPFHSQEVHGVRPLILMMLVLRIWYWINLQFPYCYFSYWYHEEKFCLGHTWEFSGLKTSHPQTSHLFSSWFYFVALFLDPCDSGWLNYQTICIKYFPERRTWSEARETCRDYEGDLVTIHDRKKQTFVYKNFAVERTLWIGLVRNEEYVTWVVRR